MLNILGMMLNCPIYKGTEMYDEYLGDGVYASFDGIHIVLDLRGQDNTTRIALDSTVFDRLIKYRNNAILDSPKEQND